MIPEYEKRIALRLPQRQRQQIDKLVESGKYKNRSIVVRDAISEFLEK